MPETFPFNILAKPTGPKCNLQCRYCYYLEKEALFPNEKRFRMPRDVLETYVRDTINASLQAGMTSVPFSWQGGEPTLLGISYFQEILDLQRKYAPPDIAIGNALQTNGTLLDEDWGHFLKDNAFLVGISLDGPRKVHDKNRTDRNGCGSYEAALRGLEILQRHGVEHNALTVVHRDNATKGREIYKFLKTLGIQHMQFIPIVERSTDGQSLSAPPQIGMKPENAVTAWSVSPRTYGKFLNDVFDVWFKKDIGKIHVQFFESQVSQWLGQGALLCVLAEKCGNSLAIEHNGNLYSCDHYVYDDFLLGNVTQTPMQDMIWSKAQRHFGNRKQEDLTTQCRSCQFLFACNGGCPKHRFGVSSSGEAGHNYLCESYTMFFRHAGPRIQHIARTMAMGLPAEMCRTAQGNPAP